MPESQTTIDRLLEALHGRSPVEVAGWATAAMGAVLLAVGIALERQGADVGASVRSLGVILLVAALGVWLFGDARRRRAVIGGVAGAVGGYMRASAHWELSNRVGVAAMLIGLILLAPALVASVLFGTSLGVAIIAPGIVLFWGGLALMVWAWFRRHREWQEWRDWQRWQQGGGWGWGRRRGRGRGWGRGRGPRGRGGRWRP